MKWRPNANPRPWGIRDRTWRITWSPWCLSLRTSRRRFCRPDRRRGNWILLNRHRFTDIDWPIFPISQFCNNWKSLELVFQSIAYIGKLGIGKMGTFAKYQKPKMYRYITKNMSIYFLHLSMKIGCFSVVLRRFYVENGLIESHKRPHGKMSP